MIKKVHRKIIQDIHLTELLKGSFVAFILKMIGMGIGYLTILFITNKYGAETYGLLILSITVLSIFALFPKFGMDVATVRILGEILKKHKSELFKTYKKIFIFIFILSSMSSVLLYFSSNFISNSLLHKFFMSQYLQIISLAIVSTVGISVLAAYFQSIKNTKVFIFIQTVLHQMIFLVLIIVNYYLLNKLYSIITIYVISNIFAFIVAIITTYYDLLQKCLVKKTKENSFSLKAIVSIAFPMLFASSFSLLMGWSDILMLGIFRDENEVGVYAAAQRVAALTGLSLIAINSVAAPKFIQFYSNSDMLGLKKIAQQSTKLIFFSSFPLLIIFFLFPAFVMNFFGEEFTKGSTTLLILTVGQFVNAISGSVGYIMQMTDNQKVYQHIIIVAAIFNIILNYFFIPLYGIEGAAVASSISIILWNLLLVYYIYKKLGFLTLYIPGLK